MSTNDATPEARTQEWTPARVRELRNRYQESQTDFGLRIFDARNEQERRTVQGHISKLENGHVSPNMAVRKTLIRLEREAPK